jgi:hypothetical protein
MTPFFKKFALGSALAATALASATPAMADPYGNRRHNGGDTAGAAVVGGIIGLTIGALLASAGNRHRRCDGDRNDDRRCYRGNNGGYSDGYYGNQYPQGGYYDQNGRYYEQNGRYYDGNRHDDDRDGRDGRYEDRDGDHDYRRGY